MKKRLSYTASVLIAIALASGCSDKLSSVDDFMASGQEFIDKGEYKKSIDTYKQGLEEYPNSLELLLALSDAYLTSNQIDKSEDILIKALKIDSSNRLAYKKLQTLLEKKGESAEYLLELLASNNLDIPEDIANDTSLKNTKIADSIDTEKSSEQEDKSEESHFGKLSVKQDTNLRNNPTLESSNVITVVKAGEILTQIDKDTVMESDSDGRTRNWINVKTSSGKKGWVSDKALNNTDIKDVDTPTKENGSENKPSDENFTEDYLIYSTDSYGRNQYMVTQLSNIRSYASLDADVVCKISKGDIVTELSGIWSYEQDSDGRDRAWINVQLSDGTEGWISKRALDKTNN